VPAQREYSREAHLAFYLELTDQVADGTPEMCQCQVKTEVERAWAVADSHRECWNPMSMSFANAHSRVCLVPWKITRLLVMYAVPVSIADTTDGNRQTLLFPPALTIISRHG
jgi:hypothetical protein